MAESFPNLMKIINLHIQEAQQMLSRINPKIDTSRHIIVKRVNAKTEANSGKKQNNNDLSHIREPQYD